MTNTYLTGNALGSSAPKDLFDNASNFDELMNSTAPSALDRFNRTRQTWAGAEYEWQQILANAFYEPVHLTYVDGAPLVVSRPSQLFDRAGSVYRIKMPATFPVTLTGIWATDLTNVVDVGDGSLRSDLASQGAAIVKGAQQTVDSIAALRALDKTKASRYAFAIGYYATGDGGGGPYYYDAADTTSPDNGGTVIVAIDGARWKLLHDGVLSVEQFGARKDGVTSNTAAIQKAIDYSIPLGFRVFIPAGVFAVDGDGLTISNTGAGGTGGAQSINYRTTLYGSGQGTSILKWTGASAKACLTIATGGTSRSLFENFSILQEGATKKGYGLKLSQTSVATFRNICIEGFENGVKADDNFSIVWDNCRFANNLIGFDATFNFVSRPNAFSFTDCVFQDNETYGAQFENPTTLNIRGGTFEGNGSMVSGSGALKINGNPIDGIAGLDCRGVYFEGNGGSFDIGFYDSATGGIHNITSCTFNRISNVKFTSGNVVLYKNTPVWRTLIGIEGNGFAGFGSYVANSSRRYVQVVSPIDNNWVVRLGLNIYGDSTEVPAVAGAMANTKQIAAAVRFNGVTGTIDGVQANVISVVRNGVGDYTINYAKPMILAKNAYSVGMASTTLWPELFSESAAHLRFKTKNASGVYADFPEISVLVYGEDGGI